MTWKSFSHLIFYSSMILLLSSRVIYCAIDMRDSAVDEQTVEQRRKAHQQDLYKIDIYYSELRKVEAVERSGNYSAAIDEYDKLIEKYQGKQAEVSLKWTLMKLYIKLENFKKALDLIDWRINLEKKRLNRPEILDDFNQTRQALVLESEKNYVGAILIYEKRLAQKVKGKKSSANETVVEGNDRRELIRLYEKAGFYEKAIEQINWFLRYRRYDELEKIKGRLLKEMKTSQAKDSVKNADK